MYGTQSRGKDPVRITGVGGSTTNPFAVDFTFPRIVQGLYSWRTGAGVKDFVNVPESESLGIQSSFRGESNLFDKLNKRRQYLNTLSNTVGEIVSRNGRAYSSRTDNGHDMASLLIARNPWVVQCTFKGTPSRPSSYPFTGWCNFASLARVPNDTGRIFPFSTEKVSPLLSGTQLRGVQNGAYFSSRPNPPSTTLLTSVIELLRGDIPSVVKNIRRFVTETDKKKYLSYIGSESLNIQFGWSPIISEFANVIVLLLKLDAMVFGDSSYRRHRSIEGPTIRTSSERSGGFSNVNTPFNAGTYMVSGVTGRSSGRTCANVRYTHESTVTENYRFSAKFRGIAKPTAKSGRFLDQAQQILRDLGVGDPAILWELTPWSWLVDYFAHLGQAITNSAIYSPQSGEYVQDYAYWTRQTVRTEDVSSYDIVTMRPSEYSASRVISKPSFIVRSRVREQVTPFGFGTRFGSLSANQLGILVSLGLARSHA